MKPTSPAAPVSPFGVARWYDKRCTPGFGSLPVRLIGACVEGCQAPRRNLKPDLLERLEFDLAEFLTRHSPSQSRLGLAVRLSRVLAGRPTIHDLIVRLLHGLVVVEPAAFGQPVWEIVNQNAGLIDP